MNLAVKTEGFAELERSLFALENSNAATRAGKLALDQAAEPIVETWIRLAPDDPATPVGLKQAIKSKTLRRKDTVTALIGIDASVDPPETRARKRGKGSYRDPGVAGNAVIQEFGTSKMDANPSARPAWDAHAAATPGRIALALGPAIEREAARLAKRR